MAHYNLGISLGNLHQDEKAERELEIATKLQPGFARAYVARGLALARLGKIDDAIKCLTAALEIHRLGITTGDLAGAVPHLQRAGRRLRCCSA